MMKNKKRKIITSTYFILGMIASIIVFLKSSILWGLLDGIVVLMFTIVFVILDRKLKDDKQGESE